MAEDQDDSQKTEEPTQKRLEEAVKKGQVASSREISSFFILLALTMIVLWGADSMMQKLHHSLAPFLVSPHDFEMDTNSVKKTFFEIAGITALVLLIPFVATIVAAFAASFLQNRLIFSLDPIMPKLEKISPLKGWNRLFSMKSFVEFIKGILKITIVGVVATIAVWPELVHLQQIVTYDFNDILTFIATLSARMLIGVCIVMFFIAIADFLYQRFEYIKGLRMTKQEIRDEYKQQEGDPMVKQRLRSIRMERARTRMMMAVPKSDVIITNPTHYSVALKYDSASMKAPVLVAKGLDHVALRIREIAKEHSIPLVENPPLARALYAAVELDEEIPYEHYKAVAEVIGFIYRQRGKMQIRK